MFDLKAIVGAMGREGTERLVHEQIADRIRAEIAKGNNSHNVAVNFLVGLRDSNFLRAVQELLGPHATGLGLTAVGAGLAEWLRTANWKLIGADDPSPIMREVRFILQNVVPSLLVGGAEGISDNFDYDKKVREEVSKYRSNDELPGAQKPGRLDTVCYLNAVGTTPGLIFFYEYTDDGMIRRDAYDLPCCTGPEFQAEKKRRCDPVPRTKMVSIPQGKDKSPRQTEEAVDAADYKKNLALALNAEELPIGVAIRRLDTTTGIGSTALNELLRRTEPKEEKKPEAPKEIVVDENGRAFQFIWSSTMAAKVKDSEKKIGRDLLSDIGNRPKLINELGAYFVPRAVGGKFTDADVAFIYEHVQTWMGSTLTFENKFFHALEHAKGALKSGEGLESALGKFVHVAGAWAVYSVMAILSVFVTAFVLYMFGGFFVNVDAPTFDLSWKTDWIYFLPTITTGSIACIFWFQKRQLLNKVPAVLDPTNADEARSLQSQAGTKSFLRNVMWIPTVISLLAALLCVIYPALLGVSAKTYAISVVSLSATIMIIEMLLCTVIEGALAWKWIHFLVPDFQKESLKDKGRVYCMVIGAIGFLALAMLYHDAAVLKRAIVLGVLFLVGVSTQFGLTANGAKDEAEENTKKTLRALKTLSLIFILSIFIPMLLTAFGTDMPGAIMLLKEAIWLHALLIFIGVAFALTVLVLVGGLLITKDDGTTYYKKQNGVMQALVFALALVIASWYYYAKTEELKNAPASVATTLTTKLSGLFQKKTPQADSGKKPDDPAASAVRAEPSRPTNHRKRAVSPSPAEEDACSGYSSEMRKRLGCE